MTHSPALTIASHYQHLQLVWSKLTRQPPAPAGASCRGQRICLGPVLSSEGCFSTVYGGTLVHTGAPVAVKRVELGEAGGSPTRLRREQQMRREIRNLSSLDHANIVALLDVVEDDTSISLVLERCWGGELYTFINSLTFDGRRTRLWQDEPADSAQPPLEAVAVTEAQIARIVRQILLALDFMHSHDVVHRDLKPENLMLLLPFAENQEPVIKLVDFGFSIHLSQDKGAHPVCGSPLYLAPEVESATDAPPEVTPACDIYAMGVIAFSLLCCGTPPPGARRWNVVTEIQTRSFFCPDYARVSTEARRLIARLTKTEARSRPSAGQALQSDWLAASTLSASPLFSANPDTHCKSENG
eukprot:Tamp_07523.p1 GENE.Tamp_07523~~Tamp_07523.p1  ORF type:complete len:357 (+),score=46.05 Tamp_07523:107-1177(+)